MTEVLTYEALKAERDVLEVRLRNALSSEQEAIQRAHAANQTIDALAVENAALKTSHPQPFGREMMKAIDAYEKHQDEVPETGMLDAFFILRDSIRVETPATSAALAAIQAQGVEKFAERMLTLANDPTYNTASHRNDLRVAGAKAKDYAANLREAK
ncbi:hypothetical protein [Serratia marcescens]|uniref:hypothetical protein n=1 Tax=Serratia marcescens TaxID=615 RepID=UPI00202A96B7|nr:hypothetical protein [Serratia marcescens]